MNSIAMKQITKAILNFRGQLSNRIVRRNSKVVIEVE